ncbi:MAG: hypothetical protein IJH00_02000 [Erysipelotrichaceae bacterium]|nr:hypothetical protein [Erysipelotrichaceae bacterium]
MKDNDKILFRREDFIKLVPTNRMIAGYEGIVTADDKAYTLKLKDSLMR